MINKIASPYRLIISTLTQMFVHRNEKFVHGERFMVHGSQSYITLENTQKTVDQDLSYGERNRN